ncbi:hypothetical protein OOZ63_11830 [Paucibacter sp. PLA-PC-4]|uniref:hypothetical protein n=1 Tax=Paucibacter sp. PLA-PC-4 TaxID=2993655 RepID=UPI0022495086|nr:hypothetical protein [Paucibacter sp. PLA-PC-4]MCX2862531.1 hypothetical protein [Paucibacter sp. PLA-PC-4]
MTRQEIEHLVRDSREVTDPYAFIIVGSQSMLGQVPNLEAGFTMSAEADIYALHAPSWRTRSKAHSAKARSSTRPMANAPKVSDPGPSSCLRSGQSVHRVQNSATNDRVGYCLDVVDMPLDDAQHRRRRASIRRWVKAVRGAGYEVADG